MALLRKTGNGIETITPGFYRTFVCTYSYYKEHKSEIPDGTIIYITDDSDSDSDALEKVWPVGSVYITVDSAFDPNDYFDFGTWVKLESDSYLKTANTEDPLTISGSNTKTITVNNLPPHNHDFLPTGFVTSTFSGTATSHTHTLASVTAAEASDVVYSRGSGSTLANGGLVFSNSTGTKGFYSTNGAGTAVIGNSTVTPVGSVTSTFKGTTGSSSNTGSGTALNVQPKSISVIMWRRTA